jgi:SEC-C motif
MNRLNTAKMMDLSCVDPRGGVLVYATYWRPAQGASDPMHPGEKANVISYLPVAPRERCPCGSGHLFEACCQSLPYWQPVCPNPGMQGYRPMEPQVAHFSNVPTDAVYALLQKDDQLYCVQDNKPHTFWILWGTPALQAPYGILCFGDLEVREDRTLVVTALSTKRMETLIDLLQPLNLDTPQIQHDPAPHVEKPRRSVPVRKRRRSS